RNDPLMATVARRCEGVGAGARRSQVKNLLVSASSFSLYFAISFSSLDFLFLFTDVIVTWFMNFLQLNPAQSLFHTA
ncbi:hypothetical protein, partial [Escherichia coli]|uniref:hypothetical protein n=1 Tax=Escherichia coli TaxID=562 RepID=UPI001BFC5EB8